VKDNVRKENVFLFGAVAVSEGRKH